MRQKKIGVLIVGEAHLNDERRDDIEALFNRRLKIFHSEDPDTPNARGVAIVLNKEITETENVVVTEIVPGRAILLETRWHQSEVLSILGVYAPVNPVHNAQFWTTIRQFFEDNPNVRKPDIMGGDMNITEDTMTDILLDKTTLSDGWRECFPTTLKYTWRRPATGAQSRLDRIYVKSGLSKYCYEWDSEKSGIPTDHDMVSVRFSTANAPEVGRGRWVMPIHIVKDSKVKGFIIKEGMKMQEEMEDLRKDPDRRTVGYNAQKLWARFNDEWAKIARERSKIVMPRLEREIQELEAKITVAENSVTLPDEDEEEKATEIIKMHQELDVLVKKRHNWSRENARARNTLEGEVISKYWSGTNREIKPKDSIKRLKKPGRPSRSDAEMAYTTNSHEMANYACDYHRELQDN
ncbi:Endonuclease/exonuclease/phosphatase [Mucidula mucida]|nr:Endonuclease/exonuclease/phosphatase [Mucidula mucida]